MSEYSIGKKMLLRDVEEISISEEKVLVRGADKIIKEVDKSSLSGGSAISVTKFELDNLISNNALIPGAYYIVSGVHPALYDDGTSSGTTIYIRAATTNTLEKNGHGQFWNPKYDQSEDCFGVWTNIGTWKSEQNYSSSIFALTTSDSFAIDSKGNLYIPNYNSNNVTKITPDGTSSIFGTANNPYLICIDSNDNIYVPNIASENITKITPDGTSTIFGPRSGNTEAIGVDYSGNIYIIDSALNNVAKITPDGTSTIFGTTGSYPRNMVFDSDNNLYTVNTNSDNVTKITPDGTSIIFGTTGSTPRYIGIDSDNNIYTTNAGDNSVTKITPDGTSNIFASIAGSPRGIVIDSDDNVYVTDVDNNTVLKINQDGVSAIFGTTGKFPERIILDSSGNIYTINRNSYNITKINSPIEFEENEVFITNTNATGKLFGLLSNNKFIALNGNLQNSTTITGINSGTTAIVTNITIQDTTIGTKTIWGGYSWTNNSGNIGSAIDQFTLSYDWTKDQYNEDNYDKVLDIVEYDYPNDWISRRYETGSGCDVIYTKSDYDNYGRESAIKAFQFGNPINPKFYRGVSNIIVSHSYFENINFAGSYQRYIVLNSAEQSNCIFGPNTYQEYLTFSGGSSQQGVEFKNNSGQIQCTFKEGSSSGDYSIPSDSIMSNLSLLKNSSISNISANEDSLLFNSSILKEIYNRPDGTTKIRYYDNDDNLVISDITD